MPAPLTCPWRKLALIVSALTDKQNLAEGDRDRAGIYEVTIDTDASDDEAAASISDAFHRSYPLKHEQDFVITILDGARILAKPVARDGLRPRHVILSRHVGAASSASRSAARAA